MRQAQTGAPIARPPSPHVRASWHLQPGGAGRREVVVGLGEQAVVIRGFAIDQVLERTTEVALAAGQAIWWFRTEPTSLRVGIDWQGGKERYLFALGLEISFVVTNPGELALWLLDQQEPDDVVEALVARTVSRRVSWLLAEQGPVRSELQRLIMSEIRTSGLRPICPGVAVRQVIVSQCERRDEPSDGVGRRDQVPASVTAATAAYRVEDLASTEEIDVSQVMADSLRGESAEEPLFSSDFLPAIARRPTTDITRPALAATRRASGTTENDAEPYADIEVGFDATHPSFPVGSRVLVADHRGRWQAAVVTRSSLEKLEVQVEHTGMVLAVTPSQVMLA